MFTFPWGKLIQDDLVLVYQETSDCPKKEKCRYMCIRKYQARPILINSHDCIHRQFDFLGLDTNTLKKYTFSECPECPIVRRRKSVDMCIIYWSWQFYREYYSRVQIVELSKEGGQFGSLITKWGKHTSTVNNPQNSEICRNTTLNLFTIEQNVLLLTYCRAWKCRKFQMS